MTATPPTPARVRFDALTGLRIFAAMHVVLFHYATGLLGQWERTALQAQSLAYWPARTLNTAIRCGAVSVSLFFILSGFVLYYSFGEVTSRGALPARKFWIARFSRIYPVYLVGLLLMCVWMGHAFFVLGETTKIARSGILSVLLLQSWSATDAMIWNLPGWSLSCEAFFYLLFPAIAAPIGRVCAVRLHLALWLTLVAIITAASNYLLHADVSTRAAAIGAYLFHCPLARLPEFIAGLLLARLFLESREKSSSKAILATASLAGVLLLLSLDQSTLSWTVRGLFLGPCFAGLIYALAFPGALTRLLSVGWIVFLGEVSYGVYILHYPFRIWFDFVAAKLGMGNEMHRGLSIQWGFWVCLAGVVLISILSYLYFEIPMRELLKRYLSERFSRDRRIKPSPVLPARVAEPTGDN